MLNHVILWTYASVWKPPITGLRPIIEDPAVMHLQPEEMLLERDAFEQVMRKARSGAAMPLLGRTQTCGWC
jgi:hypothetical protein